ncbi:MAG: tetratricopeptide repeat protein, partial [Chitinophagaceae bacterium]|nr:tetratricopeptide repeat protein [Chitinophagaceae bacterium]
LNELCNQIMSDGNYFPALEYGKQALMLSQTLHFKRGEANANRLMGRIQKKLGNHPESLKCFLATLKLNEELGDKKGIAGAYNNIGTVYLEQKQYEEALSNINKALAIFKEIKDKTWIHNTYTNLGNIYTDQGKYTEAMSNYTMALQIRQELGDIKGVSAIYNNIGLVNQLQRDYKTAAENFTKALNLAKSLDYKGGMANAYFNLGMANIGQKKYTDVRDNMLQSLSLCEEMKNLDGIKECYQGLSTLDSALGNFKGALMNYKIFVQYRDSLINEENTKKIVQQQMQYEFDKKEIEQQMVQQKKEAIMKRNRNLVFLGIGMVMLLMLWWFYQSRQKQIASRKLALAEMKSHISRDLHDEIGSTLSSISMQAEVVGRKLMKQENAQEIVHNISMVSKDMMSKMSDIVWSLNLNHERLEVLVHRVEDLCAIHLTPIQIEFEVSASDEVKNKTLSAISLKECYLMIKESMNNMMKYAEATMFSVSFSVLSDQVQILILDNGKGFVTANKTNKLGGEGLKNMQARADKMKGSIDIHSDQQNGTKISILIPLAS